MFQVKPSAPYSPRDKNSLYRRNPKAVTYGTELISFLAPKSWPIVPQEVRNFTSLDSFNKTIRKWKPSCLFRLCKTYLQHAGLYNKMCQFYIKLFEVFFFSFICHVMIIISMFMLYVRYFALIKMICYIFPH